MVFGHTGRNQTAWIESLEVGQVFNDVHGTLSGKIPVGRKLPGPRGKSVRVTRHEDPVFVLRGKIFRDFVKDWPGLTVDPSGPNVKENPRI